MSSNSSHSRLVAQFQPPKFLTPGKRKQDYDDFHSYGGSSSASSDKKKRMAAVVIRSDSDNVHGSDDDDDDDDECMPMSESQLNRHSKVSIVKRVEPDSSKVVEARIERIALQNRAAQYKENRLHPTTSSQRESNYQTNQSGSTKGGLRYVLCMWRAPQTRKHKTWDGDACLILGPSNRLIDTKNKHM